MNKDVILNKLNSLKRCLQRVEQKVPQTKQDLHNDLDAQDIVSLNLQRAVQLSVDIAAFLVSDLDLATPLSMAEGFDRLEQARIISSSVCSRMKKAVGFRNIAVHDYCSIDWDIVFSVSTTHIEDFKEFAREIIEFLNNQKE